MSAVHASCFHHGRSFKNAAMIDSGHCAPMEGLFQFGLFELDVRAGELRKRGIRIKLQEQPLHLLALLIESAGDVVTREQIQQKLWCADTFVDFDNAINSAIRKLRDALGDNSEIPGLWKPSRGVATVLLRPLTSPPRTDRRFRRTASPPRCLLPGTRSRRSHHPR